MSRKLCAAAVFTSLCMLLLPAYAQNNQASGLVGRTFISDQGIKSGAPIGSELRSGKGLTLEGNYARRLRTGDFLGLSVEVPFVFNPDEDFHTPNTVAGDYRAFFVTPAAHVAFFPGFAVSPWVSVGGGFGHFSGTNTAGSTRFSTSNTAGVFEIGVGFDVRVYGRMDLRLAARDLWSGTPDLNVDTGKDKQHNIFVGVGPVFHF